LRHTGRVAAATSHAIIPCRPSEVDRAGLHR
jgi:hypothetical protein